MKRIVKIIFILIVCLSIKTVYAENYKIKELIPYNTDITLSTNNFTYKGIYFDLESVHFNGIVNLTDKKIPVSISIGLFDKSGINIGTINYCDLFLDAKQEMSFRIDFSKEYFGNGKTNKDVKYIAVLGDNIKCKTGGSHKYLGKHVDRMGISHRNKFDNSLEIFLAILTVIGGLILIFIVSKLVMSKKTKNDNKPNEKKDDEII